MTIERIIAMIEEALQASIQEQVKRREGMMSEAVLDLDEGTFSRIAELYMRQCGYSSALCTILDNISYEIMTERAAKQIREAQAVQEAELTNGAYIL